MNVLGKTKKNTNFFSAPIKKEITKIDKDGNESVDNISYKIKYTDSARFMATSLSNLVDNLAERFIKLNGKIVIVFLNMKVSRAI